MPDGTGWGKKMGKIKAWEFGDVAEFDGRELYAEVTPVPDRPLVTGTLEVLFRAGSLHRATLLARGVPGRDEGAFTLTMTHAGAVMLTCTDIAGAPCRFRTADGLVGVNEFMQATLAWGRGGAFTVVNLDRRRRHPDDPGTGHVRPLPADLAIMVSGRTRLTFAAAASGAAPHFHGRIDRVTLADAVEPPTVPPATARILRPGFGRVILTPPAALKVATPDGARPIPEIRAGDRVLTRDHGAMTVLSNLRVELDATDFGRDHPLRPHLARAPGVAPFILGPLQRALDGREGAGIDLCSPGPERNLVYHHLLFARTVAVRINGLWVEMRRPRDGCAVTLPPA